jgi:hypothetical protein
MRKIEGEEEPGMEPCPPVAILASHGHVHVCHTLNCAQYRSRAALWIVTSSGVARGVHVGSSAPNPYTCAPILCTCIYLASHS